MARTNKKLIQRQRARVVKVAIHENAVWTVTVYSIRLIPVYVVPQEIALFNVIGMMSQLGSFPIIQPEPAP